MSERCAIQTCKRASRTLCHCCNQNLCREHFIEHDDLLNSQLNPLVDEINKLGERLTILNIDQILGDARKKLNQWRVDCHEKIDRLYEQKYEELDRYITEKLDKQRKEIHDVHSKIAELSDKQETTKQNIDLLASTIRTLEQKMNEIEQNRVQIDIRPLVIDNNFISIENTNEHRFNLLTASPPYRTCKRSGISTNNLTNNERFLLAHMDSNLCLIDKELSIVKRKEWTHDRITSMCWSSTLDCFVIITTDNIFLLHENTMTTERIKNVSMNLWQSCACSQKSLYLSRFAFDSTIFEYSLTPSIQFMKQWHITDASTQKQRTDNIIYNNKTLLLAINDEINKTKLIELRSSDTFDRLWSLRLDLSYNNNSIRCCLLTHDEWLVIDWSRSSLFHISNDGKLKEVITYNSVPYNIRLFSSNILVIITKEKINFHKV